MTAGYVDWLNRQPTNDTFPAWLAEGRAKGYVEPAATTAPPAALPALGGEPPVAPLDELEEPEELLPAKPNGQDDGPPEPVHIPAARADVAVPSRKSLRFRTAREIAETTPEDVPWAVPPWLAFGAITELDGKPKAAGKTTLALEMIRAMLDGLPFLGQPTARTPVVLLSEQNDTSLRQSLERSGLTERDDLLVLTWSEAAGVPWPDVVTQATAAGRAIGARALVVDTLPQFAGLRGDSENDSGAALQAIEPLQLAAAEGWAVLVNRHDRKGGGDVGESARGSGAFTGAVDVVLALSRDPHDLRLTMRRLFCLSRFSDAPADLMLELVEGRYVVLGSIETVRASALQDTILGLLPEPGEDPVAPVDLTEAAGKDETTIKGALNAMLREAPPRVTRSGAGRKGNPYRWARASQDAGINSGTHPTGVGTNRMNSPADPGPSLNLSVDWTGEWAEPPA